MVVVVLGFAAIVIIGVRDYKKEQQALALMSEKESMVKSNRISQNAMASTALAYQTVYYLDLQDTTCRMIYPVRDDGAPRSYRAAMLDCFGNGIVAEESEEELKTFLQLENIVNSLSDKEHINLKYCQKKENGESEWCQITLIASERDRNGLQAVT